MMCAWTQEETSSVSAGFSWAAVWECSLLHGLQTQLGLLVDELAAQLRQEADTRGKPNAHRDHMYLFSYTT